jgi:hypothetical protein
MSRTTVPAVCKLSPRQTEPQNQLILTPWASSLFHLRFEHMRSHLLLLGSYMLCLYFTEGRESEAKSHWFAVIRRSQLVWLRTLLYLTKPVAEILASYKDLVLVLHGPALWLQHHTITALCVTT